MSNPHQQRSAMAPVEQRQPSHFSSRRPPAHRSVSLRHSPPKSASASAVHNLKSTHNISQSGRTSTQTQNNSNSDGSPSSLRPLNGRGSSGESSNADQWFDKSNNAAVNNSNSYADNDPPFFMRHGSSSESPPDGQLQQRIHQFINQDGSHSLPLRAGQLKLGTPGGSSTEDFRGVIDDLTVENKKLKRRLKKYEKLHDAHLKNDKLFEIRVHGLQADKKRELEELLRNFAGSLSTQPTPGFPTNGYEGILPGLKSHQTASSQTSIHHTDSAYASMSASGQGSSAPSGGDSKHRNIVQAAKSRQQNIHSFLHHIPEGLQPNHNPGAMTERAKKKLVVRRLEQIFAGTDAIAGPHYQALQQQDVSQMAARADRKAIEARGHPVVDMEGLRESAIMNQETEEPLDIGSKRRSAAKHIDALNHQESEKVAEYDFAATSPDAKSDEQRPTRPLDLDPDRAQIPADNVRYIRHLGFSPQDPEYQSTPEEGHGWVYLNLLVNMAQLHTIHVTPDFVRKAVNECSDHFEVSEDGRKVRWRGGAMLTRTSSYGGDSSRERTDEDGQSPRKKLKTSNGTAAQSTSARVTSQRGNGTSARKPQQELGRLMYTPLFSHRSASSDSEASSSEDEEEDDSPYQQQVGAESSAMTSSGVRTVVTTKKKKSHDNGPIIFYNNARFCTDLSGDSTMGGNVGAPNYRTSTLAPVGKAPARQEQGQLFEKRGPLEEASLLPEPMDLADNPIPESLELAFPPQSPPKTGDAMHPAPCVNLEVTGMGGVYPADNFAINVESRHAVVDQDEAPSVPVKSTTRNLPDRFAKILQGDNPQRKVRAAVAQRYLNIQCTEHPPSVLPPALCFVPDDESMSDDDSDPVDEMSVSPASHGDMPPSTAPQTMYMPDVDSEDSDEDMEDDEDDEDSDSDDSDAESDGSLDLLATARKADPEAVLRKERQYDAEMAERLAEEIPAGSSAATAGGGSGFASPASGVDKREYRKAKEEARAKQQIPHAPASLKRARTSDSMDVQGQEGSNMSSDESDDE